jgi:hypothetical protein
VGAVRRTQSAAAGGVQSIVTNVVGNVVAVGAGASVAVGVAVAARRPRGGGMPSSWTADNTAIADEMTAARTNKAARR